MSDSHKKQKKDKLIYAAIDFGTTYSGYAFSLRDALDKNPTDISTIAWRSGSTALQSSKVPTCILFDRNKQFSAFGYEAENKYTDLAFDGEHKEWYFFRHFKMSLYNKQFYHGGKFTYTRFSWYSHTSTAHNNLPTKPSKQNSGFYDIGNKLWVIEIVKVNGIGQTHVFGRLNRNYTVEDELGNTMPAMDVFHESIRYLKNHLMSTIKERFLGIRDTDVFWVITVPAVWNETAKQFMYEAAIKTGISNEDLVLALEPEAASIFCINTQLERNKETEISFLKPGSKYMVVDAGGGTVDITVHSVRENRRIDELHSASGGDWGGSYVDEAFGEFLNTIFGKQVMDTFRKENTIDMLDLQRDFECKKRDMSLLNESRIQLRLPLSLLDLYKEKKITNSEQTCLESTALQEVRIVGDKMRIEHSKARTFFKKASEELLQHLKELFEMENVQNINTILMVGGFAESQFLKETIRTSFPEKRVVIPDDPGLAVLKGAVIFGHNPSIIKSRMSRYTYGFGINRYLPYLHFNENNVSQEDTVIKENGDKLLQNVFDKHVTKCQILEFDKVQSSKEYTASNKGDYKLCLYISDEFDPILVTDPSCHLIGFMEVKVGNRSGANVRVNLRFGDTKIKVEVIILDTGVTFDNEFDCLV